MNAVFQYQEARQYLASRLAEKQKKNDKYSLRAFSKQLGFKTPSLVSSILTGKRKLSVATAKRMAKAMKLSLEESTYFELLALRSQKAQMTPSVQRRIKLDEFKFISEWHHYAILEMLEMKDFDPSPEKIAKRLKYGVTAAQVRTAIKRLIALGFIKEDDGKLRPTTDENKVGDEVPDAAVRSHHISMLRAVIEAYKTEPMNERDLRGSIFAIRKTDFPKAIAILRECHSRIRQLSVPTENEIVCRFSTQLFKLSR